MVAVTDYLLKEGHIALLKELPSEEAHDRHKIPHITCASPMCPNFDKSIEPGSVIVSIEPEKNLALRYVPLEPVANLDEVHESPLNHNDSSRGRGKHGVLWFHLVCLEGLSIHGQDPSDPGPSEFPTLFQPLAAVSQSFQPDLRPFSDGVVSAHLNSPSLQTLYKWQGVVQLERALAFRDGNQGFYINDDMDAAYLVEEHARLRGELGGNRLETTGAEARGKPLSMLLRHIDGRRVDVLRQKGEQIVKGGSVEFAMSLERRIQQMEGVAGEEAENNKRELSDETHIDGLEFIPWTLSRPNSTTAAENTNLDDWLIPRYDATKWGSLSPEDATLIFWNRVPWHLGLPNGHIWVTFSARVVRMSLAIPDDVSTLASEVTEEEKIWPMYEARSLSTLRYRPPQHLPLWEQNLAILKNASRTPPVSESTESETSCFGDGLSMQDSCDGDVEGSALEDGDVAGEGGDNSMEHESGSPEVDFFEDKTRSSTSESILSDTS